MLTGFLFLGWFVCVFSSGCFYFYIMECIVCVGGSPFHFFNIFIVSAFVCACVCVHACMHTCMNA